MNSVEEKLCLKMWWKLENRHYPCITVGKNCAPIFNTYNSIEGVKCGTKKSKFIGRVGWGTAYLQRCWCSTNEQTKGLSYQRCGRGQGHKEQVPTSFWRLLGHPVDYTTVHDWTNHLEEWMLYHYLCECAHPKQHLLNRSNATWNGTSAIVLAK